MAKVEKQVLEIMPPANMKATETSFRYDLDGALAKAKELVAELSKAVWTTAFINDLPDSSFLFIEPGGSKDGEGKTKPRTLRHFPVRDSNGAIDLPHLRNAIARIPQSKIPGMTADKLRALQDRARRMLAEAQR